MRNVTRHVLTAVTVGLAAALPLALAFSAPASAATLNNGGPVSLNTTGSITSGTPYSSGQLINISVTTNSTLNLTNLESNGYAGEPAMKAVECSDLNGTIGNLPTTPTGNCDGSTILSTSAVSSDGSFTISNYTIYALPDSPTFGEPSTQKPVCGLAPNYCVLYIGPAQLDFSKPHLFSAPFQVLANADDGGESPGDGTPETPLVIGLPLLGMAVGGSALYLRRRRSRAA